MTSVITSASQSHQSLLEQFFPPLPLATLSICHWILVPSKLASFLFFLPWPTNYTKNDKFIFNFNYNLLILFKSFFLRVILVTTRQFSLNFSNLLNKPGFLGLISLMLYNYSYWHFINIILNVIKNNWIGYFFLFLKFFKIVLQSFCFSSSFFFPNFSYWINANFWKSFEYFWHILLTKKLRFQS